MTRVAVLLVAKYPDPGRVNTRMVPPLSPDQAAALHEAALRAVAESAAALPDAHLTLVGTPDESLDGFEPTVGRWVSGYLPQGDGDLGARLTRAIAAVHERDRPDAIVVLGADSPTLPPARLREAIAALQQHDAVVGPCDDGGYYLIGVRQLAPALFERIPWGGADVTAATIERAREAGIDLHVLDGWYDIDRLADLERAAEDLALIDQDEQPQAAVLRTLIQSFLVE